MTPFRSAFLRAVPLAAATLLLPLTSRAQDAGVSTQAKRARLSGSFTPVQVRSSGVSMRTQSRIYGTVELTEIEGSNPRSRVRLTFTSQTGGTSFTAQWALLQGRCGTGSLPVIAIDNFPMIEVGSNGRAQLDAEIALGVPPSGEYHINVYVGGQQLDNVITCANLKR
ncbi:MAG: hypothetical protein IPF98_05685 [Gemmatimonadetes bacterium]|mgnify:CR=1 FL=1|nr:hypothetical protein [Gemmatimonadota bacterium]